MDTLRTKSMLNSKWRWIGAGAVALLLAGSTVAVLTAGDSRVAQNLSSDVGAIPAGPEARSFEPSADMSVSAMAESGRPASVAGGGARDRGMPGAAPAPAPPASSSLSPRDRVVHTGALQISVEKDGFRSAFDRVAALATELGGFVASSSSERVDGRLASGHLSLRVPGDKFETARTRLASMGKVEHESIGGEDVGGQLVDLDARLRSQRAQEDALRTLLARAKTVGEVIQVQEQLGATRQQIEQLAAQQAALNDRVAFAAFEVSIAEPGAASAPPSSVLARSWERAVGGSLAVVAGCIVVLGYAAPIAVLAALAFGIYRLTNHRRRAAGLEADVASST